MLYSVRTLTRLFICTFLICGSAVCHAQSIEEASPEGQQTAEQAAAEAWLESVTAKIKPQTGLIELPNGVATLNVPESFYYLDPQGAEVVLTEIWGNPSTGALTLGMLFPADKSPLDSDAWGVTIEYVDDGYVDDSDAGDINYDELLGSMQDDTAATSEWRVEQGYEAIELVGWAQAPYYDEAEKKLYWAKELRFGEMDENTLNYNIRVLGRKGYLLLNFIASMNQLPEINNNLDTVLDIAEFNDGNRYADFDPSVDEVAAYGLGALVAGKVLAKTGLIATAILLFKKFGLFILIAIGGAFKYLFKRKA